MKVDLLTKIEALLKCVDSSCSGNLKLNEGAFTCEECHHEYPIVDGVPRFVPESFFSFDQKQSSIQEKTKNYFGYEWEHFNNWGFIDENDIPAIARGVADGLPIACLRAACGVPRTGETSPRRRARRRGGRL